MGMIDATPTKRGRMKAGESFDRDVPPAQPKPKPAPERTVDWPLTQRLQEQGLANVRHVTSVAGELPAVVWHRVPPSADEISRAAALLTAAN